MWVLGLTGGIGSGKSAASDFFSRLNVVVVDADVVARDVVQPQQPAWKAIVEHFGSDVLLADQQLDRAWLREKVFADPNERLWLEQQTHPHIRHRMVQQLQQASSPYAVLVSPLLFETDQKQLVQRTLVVDVPESVQLERASRRDANHTDQIKRIMAAQMPRRERLAFADDVVDNSGTLEQLHHQLELLHQQYLALSAA